MARSFLYPLVLLLLTISVSVAGEEPLRIPAQDPQVFHSGPIETAKAGGDTINLMATHRDRTNGPGEPSYFGDFETATGAPHWNGWYGVDETQPITNHWHVSNYNQADPANLAAWCGDISFPSCDDTLDPVGGYGNSWHDLLEWRASVPDPGLSTTLTITGILQMDAEPGYDMLFLSTGDEFDRYSDITIWDGYYGDLTLDEWATYLPNEYIEGTDVKLVFRFKSDGAWSDEDCMWPTAGAVQLDSLNVHLVNGSTELDSFTDFQDGTLGPWTLAYPPGVGDYSKIWSGLQDLDNCRDNTGPQVAFIDDGLVVPGTGGSSCITWCYGPGGYIVNPDGGLAGNTFRHRNNIYSPVMDWPGTGNEGLRFWFDVYKHEIFLSDSPQMFYAWDVRSADTDGDGGNGIQNIEDQPWESRNFLYMGGPKYDRQDEVVSDLLVPGRDQVQIRMGTYQNPSGWSRGLNGTPAPYFDNVKVQVFPIEGPAMVAREIDLAQDNFPTSGSIDFEDLGSHSVRFDMAINISLNSHQRNDPGDSIVIDVQPVRHGAEMAGAPTMVYKVKTNPVFDPYRTAGFPYQGSVAGLPAVGYSGLPSPDKWAFDMPDSGFLFPGDELHYFFKATDGIGGADLRTSILPADTTGFATDFSPMGYHSRFTMRALPSIHSDGEGGFETPQVLFWNDFADRGGENEWYFALRYTAMIPGVDYDIYYTNGPSSGVGNGLGGRALSHLNLQYYSDMLYSSGDLSRYTINALDYDLDAGDDIGVLRSWIEMGNKDLFATGDDLATDLAANGGPEGLQFVEDILGLSYQYHDIKSHIGNQANPLVKVLSGNPVFQNFSSYLAYGGCPANHTFDVVIPRGSASILAEFTDPNQGTGAYPYAAAVLNYPASAPGSRVVTLPYDFMSVWQHQQAKAVAPLQDRAIMLRDVIAFFGLPLSPGVVADVPEALRFSATNHPNPFNPVTKITYTVPRAGYFSLKVFNVRGQLVKTLIDGQVPAGPDQSIAWDGTNDAGAAVSSGVYFYEARTGGEVKVGKMALVK